MLSRRFTSCRRDLRRADRELIESLGGYSRHERRVARVATRLFDLLARHHRLGSRDRNVLRVAALLHDAGRAKVGDADHQIHGAKIVKNDERLPLTDRQRRAVTYLVRYHCGRVPPIGRDDVLLRGDRRRKMRVLLGLLRAADGLDSRRIATPGIVAQRRGRRVRVSCVVAKRVKRARRILVRKAKFDLLERTLNVSVKLRIVDSLQAAAA